MHVKTKNVWHVARMGGVWQWLTLVVGLCFTLAAFMLLANALSLGASIDGPAPLRPDAFMIPMISCFCGVYCLNRAMRVRFRWNTEVIQDTSRYFVFREFKWRDLTEITPTGDGVGRRLVFGNRGDVALTQTGGSGTIPLRRVRQLEAYARERLQDHARTS